MPKPADTDSQQNLRDKIIGLGESSGRKSYYPMLQEKIRELQAEISERVKAENALRETLARIARQQEAIAHIATHPAVFHGHLNEAAAMITEQMCTALGTERASLWYFHERAIHCLDKFMASSQCHEFPPSLTVQEFPKYFATLASEPYIATPNARQDPRTQEFLAGYLEPNDIYAMFDVPVFVENELVAVICFEHTTQERNWHADEITFGCRIADQIALIIASQRRRLAEEQMRKAHTSLQSNLLFIQALLDALPIPVYYKDADRCYLGCNKSFEEFLGVSNSAIIGKRACDLWPEFELQSMKSDLLALQTGKSQIYESKLKHANGEMRDVIFAKQIFINASNQTTGIIGSFLDITEKNRSSHENAKLRSLLANIINSMPSVLVGVDAQGSIAQWNQQAVRVTGYEEQDVLGKPLLDVIPWLCGEMSKIKQAIQNRTPVFQSKLARQDNGETLFEDVTIYPLVTNGIEGAVIRIDDITDKVRIEEMLIQSEKMLSVGGLAAGMAHEINNPLASILGNIQVVESRLTQPLPPNIAAAEAAGTSFGAIKQYMESRGIPKMLRIVHASGAQAAQIVTNMLSFSRKSDSQRIQEDISDLLDKTLKLAATDYDLKKNYDFKKIEIIREYAPHLPKIRCSASQLQQVFLNLLRNGAEAMGTKQYGEGEQPCFHVRVREWENWIRIEIEDNGPGMDEPTRKRVFEPFFTTKPIGKGTGLGLSVSYFIISEGHGGRMGVQTSRGFWTRFVIDLPQIK